MSKTKTKEELIKHKNDTIRKLDSFINSLIESEEPESSGRADKICYWLNDWTKFIDFERTFSPFSLRRYKRGEIIKVHLGFNIGSEEGGLHYAVVLDKENAKSSPVITILPLVSVKKHTDTSKLKHGSVFLGNELFTSLNSKISAKNKYLHEEFDLLEKMVEQSDNSDSIKLSDLANRMDKASLDIKLLQRMRKEISRMKKGSIALVNQITTISKIRIYDPKTDNDILSGIKLSNEKLDLIDKTISEKFIHT